MSSQRFQKVPIVLDQNTISISSFTLLLVSFHLNLSTTVLDKERRKRRTKEEENLEV